MENLSDMYYLMRFIASRIFVYLRDIILHELSWLPEDIHELDGSKTKIRAYPFTRRAIADFVAFFTICAFFGSFLLLTTKGENDEEARMKSSTRPISPESEGEPVELSEDEDYEVINNPADESRQNPWGDTLATESELEKKFARVKLPPRQNKNLFSKKNRDATPSIIELRSSHSQHSQSTQTNAKILQRSSSSRDWLIRRTRSGHIYGKYPM